MKQTEKHYWANPCDIPGLTLPVPLPNPVPALPSVPSTAQIHVPPVQVHVSSFNVGFGGSAESGSGDTSELFVSKDAVGGIADGLSTYRGAYDLRCRVVMVQHF